MTRNDRMAAVKIAAYRAGYSAGVADAKAAILALLDRHAALTDPVTAQFLDLLGRLTKEVP